MKFDMQTTFRMQIAGGYRRGGHKRAVFFFCFVFVFFFFYMFESLGSIPST
ncbi:rCG21726, partial [Rattus norvegicus]